MNMMLLSLAGWFGMYSWGVILPDTDYKSYEWNWRCNGPWATLVRIATTCDNIKVARAYGVYRVSSAYRLVVFCKIYMGLTGLGV